MCTLQSRPGGSYALYSQQLKNPEDNIVIEKMKFVSITGPKADIDRVVNRYLSKYEIHLENALSELTTVRHLTPFLEINPYKDMLSTISSF